ncbi:hypothetical protein WA026_019286 [Henosepilachna vigintioctopunctata]|uniref:Uncharacterized protein n=1 Tax=Henosepilachna vigintioctopunctata TaxID=420089 RepID=A0AAW1U1B8_9CUCU
MLYNNISGLNGNAGSPVSTPNSKPVPPPRDHLKMEKDGRLVNRAPAPQLPARITNNNNNITSVTPTLPVTPAAITEPTREQLSSIKKYQEQIRKRKEEEDRLAAQNEFLNRSLRGSKKLQALENRAQRIINDAFSDDEAVESSGSITPTVPSEKEVVHTTYEGNSNALIREEGSNEHEELDEGQERNDIAHCSDLFFERNGPVPKQDPMKESCRRPKELGVLFVNESFTF